MKLAADYCQFIFILSVFIQPVRLSPVLPTRPNVHSDIETVAPVQQPSQPSQPSQPASQPIQPVAQPSQPVAQPSQPVVQPSQKPVQSSQQLPTRQNVGQTSNSNSADKSVQQVSSSSTGSFETSILLGNQFSTKAEIYQLTFKCTSDGCNPIPLQDDDLLWSSPETPGISEVKYVTYKGQPAILATTQNGAIVYAYPSGVVLFHKELETSFYLNVHSAEVMPDGNVVAAGSMSDGIFVVLYPDGGNTVQTQAESVSVTTAPFGHGLVYDKVRSRLYAAGYLTFLTLQYGSGSNGKGALTVLKTVPLANIYDESNKAEDANTEDGIHDLYPVDGSPDTLWLTTGEHVFQINVQDFTTTKYQNLFTIPSKHSTDKTVAVQNKGGVKSVSYDVNNGLVIAKPSPWFKEWYSTSDENYNPYEPTLVWSMPNKGFCSSPDYDITTNCKINFDELAPIWFYKARIFRLPKFSY